MFKSESLKLLETSSKTKESTTKKTETKTKTYESRRPNSSILLHGARPHYMIQNRSNDALVSDLALSGETKTAGGKKTSALDKKRALRVAKAKSETKQNKSTHTTTPTWSPPIAGKKVTTDNLDEALTAMQDSTVTELDLSQNYLSKNKLRNAGTHKIAKALQRPECSITALTLADNNIGMLGAEYLAQALESEHCHVRYLDLSNNNIRATGLGYISEAMHNTNCQLTELNIQDNKAGQHGSTGAEMLADALQSSNCQLTVLNLSDNLFDNTSTIGMVKALSHENCPVTHLNLYHNNIDIETVHHVAQSLHHVHCNITHLNLRSNKIGHIGSEQILFALAKRSFPSPLIELHMNDIGIHFCKHSILPREFDTAHQVFQYINASRETLVHGLLMLQRRYPSWYQHLAFRFQLVKYLFWTNDLSLLRIKNAWDTTPTKLE